MCLAQKRQLPTGVADEDGVVETSSPQEGTYTEFVGRRARARLVAKTNCCADGQSRHQEREESVGGEGDARATPGRGGSVTAICVTKAIRPLNSLFHSPFPSMVAELLRCSVQTL